MSFFISALRTGDEEWTYLFDVDKYEVFNHLEALEKGEITALTISEYTEDD